MDTRPGKRDRLVASAGELLHRQGVHGTTLAEIASAADVPQGNVYYYFKSRDELVRAVVQGRIDEVRQLLESLDRKSSPRARLKGLAHQWVDSAELVAAHGCPLGSLCSELNKLDPQLADDAAAIFRLVLDWAEAQFRELGMKDARELALSLFGAVQGAALLADTLSDPTILTREARRLDRWIDSLE
jgi:TetR/AcrR family transcriptional regulator, transcriptional repressor for nem operon